MHGADFFYLALVYLTAAVVSVPIAKRLGLGSVLGYLLAGVAIGPFALGLVGEGGQDVLHFAEFGVVLMLFLIGLELEPSRVWRMRGPILGLGGLQVATTTGVLTAIGLILGLDGRVALAVGVILALSSTAIVLQTLAEKDLLRTHGGQSSFAVLLFQDIAVIPILALLPLLAITGAAGRGDAGEQDHTWVAGLPGWAETLVVLAGSRRFAPSLGPVYESSSRPRRSCW
jgi:Kef-type K+ transport system membrane component KefB